VGAPVVSWNTNPGGAELEPLTGSVTVKATLYDELMAAVAATGASGVMRNAIFSREQRLQERMYHTRQLFLKWLYRLQREHQEQIRYYEKNYTAVLPWLSKEN